ncbi:MAG: ThiF family adenylyltransferase [Methylophilus sp.]|nr:ThiF family adenylyltransferase [Methylophilus sp.]
MTKLIFPGNSFANLYANLLDSDLETCAIILAIPTGNATSQRLLVSEIVTVPPDYYVERTEYSAVINPDFLISLIKRARVNQCSVIFCHTHPFEGAIPCFSIIDEDGEAQLLQLMNSRVPDIQHGSLLLTPNGCKAKKLGGDESIEIIEIGVKRIVYSKHSTNHFQPDKFDRQVRAFGIDGQKVLSSLKVVIVGLGGTGSVVAMQLAHLGITDFTLVDPDVVEVTNLNRLVGACPKDVGTPKVNVAASRIRELNSECSLCLIQGDITYAEVAQELLDCDFIFSCTDSHSSRAVLNQVAYQYFIPVVDIGVSITTSESEVTYITGRAQLLTPGQGCLICGNLLDGNQIRQELMSEEQIKMDPYFQGSQGIVQPAVISINSTMSSLAVSMFLGVVTAIPTNATLQFYDGIKGVVRSVRQNVDASCIVCSKNGAFGLGPNWQLPTRTHGRIKG